MKRSIIIMAKVPLPGKVKTRLQPFLDSDQCAALSRAFLKDAVSKAKSVCENVILAYTPREEVGILRDILPAHNNFVEQKGNNLGAKMLDAFAFAFERKTNPVVMIGTDSPTFPADYIEQAFEYLELETDVVLGKTEDGGFYLIGLRKPEKEIFENVIWSSPETFGQVFDNIKKSNLRLREIPSWYDVDERKDFEKLREEILHNQNAKRYAPETFRYIKNDLESNTRCV